MNTRQKEWLYRLGYPVSPLYAQLMRLRTLLYRIKLFKVHSLSVPIISIGNLTMGGTGKTPLVIYIARFLISKGFQPAVVSRGYGGQSKSPLNIVADTKKIHMDSLTAGDEPVHIAQSLPGIVVATGKKRFRPCQAVIQNYNCDLIILDDGFQHLGLSRNIDLVLFDVETFAGNSRVFPGGDLREPVSALSRADAFILTGVTDSNQKRSDKCRESLRAKFPAIPVFTVSKTHDRAYQYNFLKGNCIKTEHPLKELNQDYYCFCGIANPKRFDQSLAELGVKIKGMSLFKDHHRYTQNDFTILQSQAGRAGANAFITTEKDMTKLSTLSDIKLPIYTLPLEIKRNEDLETFILEKLNKIR